MEKEGVEILTCGTCLDFYGLKEKLAKETENYKLTVVSKTGEEIVSAQEIDMQADTDATVDNLKKKQNAFLWVSGLFSKAEDVNVDVTLMKKN